MTIPARLVIFHAIVLLAGFCGWLAVVDGLATAFEWMNGVVG